MAEAPSPDPCHGGLSQAEAERILREDGPNELPDTRPSLLRNALAKLWAPVPWMLELAVGLELMLGKPVEAALIAALVLFNATVALVQEGRARNALAALRSRLALNAATRRDGAWATLPARALVARDRVKLSLGDVVPADCRIAAGVVLLDQSMLTGESVPVEAGAGADAWAGALVRRGQVEAARTPNVWRIDALSGVAVALGMAQLAFACAVLAWGAFGLELDAGQRVTLAFLTLVLAGQAAIYAIRTRGSLWQTRPSASLAGASLLDIAIGVTVAAGGWFSAALAWPVIGAMLAAALLLTPVLAALRRLVADRLRLG